MEFIDKKINEALEREINKQTTGSAYEMAMNRADAIGRGLSIGKQFSMHFLKCYLSTNLLKDWAKEMFNWYSEITELKLKPKARKLTSSEIKDWFFNVVIDDIPTDKLEKYLKQTISLFSSGMEEYQNSLENEKSKSILLNDICYKYKLLINQILKIEELNIDKMFDLLKEILGKGGLKFIEK